MASEVLGMKAEEWLIGDTFVMCDWGPYLVHQTLTVQVNSASAVWCWEVRDRVSFQPYLLHVCLDFKVD